MAVIYLFWIPSLFFSPRFSVFHPALFLSLSNTLSMCLKACVCIPSRLYIQPTHIACTWTHTLAHTQCSLMKKQHMASCLPVVWNVIGTVGSICRSEWPCSNIQYPLSMQYTTMVSHTHTHAHLYCTTPVYTHMLSRTYTHLCYTTPVFTHTHTHTHSESCILRLICTQIH